jgi:hypothetical protein
LSGKFVFCKKIKVFSALERDSIVENVGIVRKRRFDFIDVDILGILGLFLCVIFLKRLLFVIGLFVKMPEILFGFVF